MKKFNAQKHWLSLSTHEKKAFASWLGTSVTALSQTFNGHRGVGNDRTIRICQYLGVKPDQVDWSTTAVRPRRVIANANTE